MNSPNRPSEVLTPGEQRAPIESFVILDADKEPFRTGAPADLDGLVVPLHERLHGQHVLVVLQRLGDNRIVKRVRYRHHHHLAASHRSNDGFEKVRLQPVRRIRQGRMGREAARRERPPQFGVLTQRAQGRVVQRANADLPHDAEPLQMIDGGKDLIVGDHSPSDDRHVERAGGGAHGRFRIHCAEADTRRPL